MFRFYSKTIVEIILIPKFCHHCPSLSYHCHQCCCHPHVSLNRILTRDQNPSGLVVTLIVVYKYSTHQFTYFIYYSHQDKLIIQELQESIKHIKSYQQNKL